MSIVKRIQEARDCPECPMAYLFLGRTEQRELRAWAEANLTLLPDENHSGKSFYRGLEIIPVDREEFLLVS